MSHCLKKQKIVAIHEAFAETKSIKAVSRNLGVSRQAVRRHLRLIENNQSPALQPDTIVSAVLVPSPPPNAAFTGILERLVSIANKDFEQPFDITSYITERAKAYVDTLGISNPIDLASLETALMLELSFRKFFMKARQASDAPYIGNPNSRHDKPALTSRRYQETADKALARSQNIITDLEIKYRKRKPSIGSGNVFVNTEKFSMNASGFDGENL